MPIFHFNFDEPILPQKKEHGPTHAQIQEIVSKQTNKMRVDYPEYLILKVLSVYNDNTFDLSTPDDELTFSRVPSIDPKARFSYKPGDAVTVRHMKSDNNRKYIKFGFGSSGGDVVDLNEVKKDKGGLSVIPLQNSSLWIQSGGFWWQSYSSLTPQEKLNVHPNIINQTENFTPGVYGTGSFFSIFDATSIYFNLLNLPPTYTNFRFTDIQINGKSYFGATPPLGYTSPDPIGYFLGRLTYDGYNNYYSNAIRGVIIVLQNIPDTSLSPKGPTFANSAITTLSVSYELTTSKTTYLSKNTSMSGPDSAISNRGLVMFPDTGKNPFQMVSDLGYVYRSDGGEIIPTDIIDTINYNIGDVGLSLSKLPINPLDIVNSLLTFDDFNSAYYKIYVQSQTVYAIAVNQSSGYYINGNIAVTYGTLLAVPKNYIETSTGGGFFKHSFIYDGTTTTIFINPGSSFPQTFNGNVQDLTASIDVYITVVASGGYVTIDFTGASIGDELVITYTSQWFLNHAPCIIGTSYPIQSLNSVKVDGVVDLLATFSGSHVTLSAPLTNAGSVVVVDYQSSGSNTITDIFPPLQDQTDFVLSQLPNPSSISVPSNSNPESGFNIIGGNPGPIPALVAIVDLVNPKLIRFALTHTAANSIDIGYKYNRVSGTLFHITSGTITERNISASGATSLALPFSVPFDATPPTNFSPILTEIGKYGGSRWQGGWEGQRWGFLFYDPSIDAYTAITPVGIFWRSRIPGTVVNVNYTFTPWPAEEKSTDGIFRGYSWPEESSLPLFPTGYKYLAGSKDGIAIPSTLNKTAPYMGVSVAEKYALQGSWPPIGPNILGRDGGAAGCADFQLNFWLRNSLNVWEVQGQLSVKLLVSDNKSSYPLYIPGTGIVNNEAYDGIVNGHTQYSKGGNSSWPASRKAAAWFIAAGWCQSNWGLSQKDKESRETFTEVKIGLDDAGFTINAVNMSGSIISHITYKCPLESTPCVSAFTGAVDYAILHTDDQFLKPTDAYYNPYSGTKWFAMTSIYNASPQFNYLKDYGYAWYYYRLASLDGPAKEPTRLYPGIPGLACNASKASNGYGNYGYGSISSEDSFSSQTLPMDSSDNLYLSLNVPFWVRGEDTVTAIVSEYVSGVYTVPGPFSVDGYPQILFNCPGEDGVPAISGIRDSYLGSVFANSVPLPDHPTVGGKYARCETQSGFTTIYLRFENFQVSYFTPDSSVDNYVTDPSTGAQRYVNTTYNSAGPLLAPWSQSVPHKKYTTFKETHDFGSGVQFYYLPGYGRDIYNGALYSSSAPYRGAAIYNVQGDNRRQYFKSSRTFLKKINFNGSSLVEVWSVDISQESYFNVQSHDNSTSAAILIPVASYVAFTRPCGRYIFLIRTISIDFPNIPLIYGIPSKTRVTVLDVYDNGSTAPDPHPRYRIYLPQGSTTLPANPIPVSVGNDYGSYPQIGSLQLFEGIGVDGKEWAIVQGTVHVNGGDPYHIYKYQITFPTIQADQPTIIIDDKQGDETPSSFNFQGIASAGNQYVFMDDNASILKIAGGG